jgi:predicted HNH restriction endonuclease
MANELWLSLVVNGSVASQADQRDLLGFTKMEGSSYRCFREIYERNRRFRRAGA